MRIWFDTEFYENGRTIDLISIGMVRDDGTTFYAETDLAPEIASQSDWLAKNVKPHLKGGNAEMTRFIWPLRLPVIRAIRAAWLDYRVHKAASDWASAGIGVGGPNQRDLWILYAIARGWC